ncbi:MAG: 6-carboxytetrahydropterin synthase QueD [bacterium]|nr:6-carboxytetrahydropterin synthase QueD [bacterium]
MLVTKTFEFSASHFLTKYHGKCEHLHGHNYTLEVSVVGKVRSDDLVEDFVVIKDIVKEKIMSQIDHTHLNDRFENPSAEVVAVWIWEQLEKDLNLYEIKLWETSNSFVTYRGPDGFHRP